MVTLPGQSFLCSKQGVRGPCLESRGFGGPRAFQRGKAEEWLGKKGAWDNSYQATFGNDGWGAGAQAILGQVSTPAFHKTFSLTCDANSPLFAAPRAEPVFFCCMNITLAACRSFSMPAELSVPGDMRVVDLQ